MPAQGHVNKCVWSESGVSEQAALGFSPELHTSLASVIALQCVHLASMKYIPKDSSCVFLDKEDHRENLARLSASRRETAATCSWYTWKLTCWHSTETAPRSVDALPSSESSFSFPRGVCVQFYDKRPHLLQDTLISKERQEETQASVHPCGIPACRWVTLPDCLSCELQTPVLVWKKSEVTQPCPTLCNPMDCSLPGSSVHEIFQARILEWVAISFSRGSSQSRDQTRVSRIVGRCFYHLSHQGRVYLNSLHKAVCLFKQDLG